MKTILLTHRFYWPDRAPCALVLKELAEALSETFDVHVFSTKPSYRKTSIEFTDTMEMEDVCTVKRIFSLNEARHGLVIRAFNAMWYALRLFFHIIQLRPALVTATTLPPIIGALSAALACRLVKSRFVYVVMDIYPDVIFLGTERRILYWLLRALDTFSIKLADHIVVLSDDMKQSLMQRGISEEEIRVIPNIELSNEIPDHRSTSLPTLDSERLTISFCGNIGNFQGLDTFKAVIHTLCESGVAQFVFMGEGKFKDQLKQYFDDNAVGHVHFIKHMPVHIAKAMMSRADLNLVSLSPGVSAYSFPSKTSTICSVSGPLLIYDAPNSQLQQLVVKYGAGIAGSYEQHPEIIQQVNDLYHNRQRIEQFRQGSASLYNAQFKRSEIEHAWHNLIFEATSEASPSLVNRNTR